MENSKIEWTHHTFNAWIGCSKVHAGCMHCYAETLMADRYRKVVWGPNGTRVMTSESYWRQPIKWNREAAERGERARVFCASLADVFEDWEGPMLNSPARVGNDATVFTTGEARERLFELIDETPNLDWLLLTKRPENVRRMWPLRDAEMSDQAAAYRHNVWLGTSISDQASADKQIPELVSCRDLSPILFLSIEPLLGPIDLDFACARRDVSCIDWVIVGGESGPGARPMHPEWVRSIRNQCDSAGIPFFFKQWGEWEPSFDFHKQFADVSERTPVMHFSSDGRIGHPLAEMEGHPHCGSMVKAGKKHAGRMLYGREWSEFPEVIFDQI